MPTRARREDRAASRASCGHDAPAGEAAAGAGLCCWRRWSGRGRGRSGRRARAGPMQQPGPAYSQGRQGHPHPGEGPQPCFDLAHIVEEGGGDDLGRCLVGLEEADSVPGHGRRRDAGPARTSAAIAVFPRRAASRGPRPRPRAVDRRGTERRRSARPGAATTRSPETPPSGPKLARGGPVGAADRLPGGQPGIIMRECRSVGRATFGGADRGDVAYSGLSSSGPMS